MKINEIFYSIQGEGYHTGTPAVFIRTSGCNLRCPFCDTRHEEGRDMTVAEIVAVASGYAARHAVITGGEPAMQADLYDLVEALHEAGFFVQLETNGMFHVPPAIDWVTCSPKVVDKTVLTYPHELKVVYQGQDMTPYERRFSPLEWSLQPCDTGAASSNQKLLEAAVDYVLAHPCWHLSLQTHKLIGVR